MFERILKYFPQRPTCIEEKRGCKMQNFTSFLMALIFFGNFEKTFFIVRRAKFALQTLTILILNIFLEAVRTP